MLPGRRRARARARARSGHVRRARSRSPGRWSASARSSSSSRRSAPGGCRSGPRLGEFEQAFARRLGVEHASAVSSGTAGLHLAIRAAGVERGRRGRDDAVLVRRLGQLPALRGRAAGLLRHRPAHAQHHARGGGRRGHRPHHRPAAGAHLRLPGRHGGLRGARRRPRAVARRGRLRGARRRPRRRHARRARAATSPCSRFYANKQLTTGEGGMVICPDADGQGADRLRAQPGPRARHGLARPRPARLQLPARRPLVRARPRPARAARRDARRARAGGRALRRARSPASRASGCPAPTRTASGAAGSSTWSSCRTASTATTRSARCATQGVDSKPYLPAIHLMSFYRERFGHREGEFPVCEDVARRSLALPFHPELTEGEVERVVAGAAGGDRPLRPGRDPADTDSGRGRAYGRPMRSLRAGLVAVAACLAVPALAQADDTICLSDPALPARRHPGDLARGRADEGRGRHRP